MSIPVFARRARAVDSSVQRVWNTVKRLAMHLEALRTAGEKMQELIAAAGTSEDEIVADFKKLRGERRTQNKS
jgi:hypothetical protein